jgi:LacI family transcriptional regulator
MSGLPRGRRATIADVAQEAGVSLSTVDRVLNGRAPVRSDTAERIHAAAQALGFHAVGVIGERVRGNQPRRTLGFLLQQPESAFYRGLARALQEATESDASMRGHAVIEYMDDISPESVSERVVALGRHVDALAVVAADHPLIGVEIDRLHEQGVPVFALISDLSVPSRAGYAGLDHRRVGRTAAWFATHLTRQPGKLAIFVGSHRFQCQELCEMSFRSYVRAHAPQFEVLEPLVTLESDRLAEEGMRDLLQRYHDLVGFYVAGGGVEGVLRAVAAERSEGFEGELVGIGHELTAQTRGGLLAGHLHAVLSVPLPLLAQRLVARMNGVLLNPALGLQQVVVPLDTQTPESG